MVSLPSILLRPGAERRVRHGYPWVYANEIRMYADAKAVTPGTQVLLRRADGEPVGVGVFNPHSLIAFRLLDAALRDAVGMDWIEAKLRRALKLRESLIGGSHFRWVHAEADGLPGLVIDRLGDVVVIQPGIAAWDRMLPELHDAVLVVVRPRTVILKADSASRTQEGLSNDVRLLSGELSSPVEAREGELTFFCDPLGGQKTGWYFDQRDHHAFAAGLARGGGMLDVYAYGGGFGVTAVHRGATEALMIDRSEAALGLARAAAERNGVAEQCDYRVGDAMQVMEQLAQEGRTFRMVSVDPPPFARSKKEVGPALKGYRKLGRLAAPLVEPGGFLMIASCSHNIEADAFLREVSIGIGKTGRNAVVLRRSGAAPDHPVHSALPETDYLKAVTFALD